MVSDFTQEVHEWMRLQPQPLRIDGRIAIFAIISSLSGVQRGIAPTGASSSAGRDLHRHPNNHIPTRVVQIHPTYGVVGRRCRKALLENGAAAHGTDCE